jgi:predicted O-linked N-acetylglucosamine transferase (SPINDLY family)
MHDAVMGFATRMTRIVPRLLEARHVVELGSRDINGGLRQLWQPDCSPPRYVGYDFAAGKGVDVAIERVEEILAFEGEGSADAVLCTEALEHDPRFWVTLDVVGKLLVPGGLLLLTARGVRVRGQQSCRDMPAMFEHTPVPDLWRFMPQSVPFLLEMANCDAVRIEDDPQHPGFLALGRKTCAQALTARGRHGQSLQKPSESPRMQHDPLLDADEQHRRGLDFQAQGRLREAETALRRSVALAPHRGKFLNNLGSLLGQIGSYEEAAEWFRRAIQVEPSYAKAHSNLAVSLVKLERFDEAEAEARAAIALQQDLPEAHAALGACLAGIGKPVAAINAFHAALELRPDLRDAVVHLATLLADVGRQDAAVEIMRRLLERAPGDRALYSNLLYALHHAHGDNAQLLLSEHCTWVERYADSSLSTDTYANDRSPERRLRVAYVSADFRDHPAARFLLPLIESHDAAQVEVVCYSDVFRPNEITARFRAASHLWRETGALTNEAFAEKVRQDRIDVLVDPTGYMANNRISAFADKPAPVQVSYFGYPGTTGLRTIGYRITDPLLDPPGVTDAHYTESLIRIASSAMVYSPLTPTPEIGPLPANRNGFVMFGALNRLSKVTPTIIGLWAQVLAAVPRARLMILSPSAVEPATNAEICQLLARHGISSDRLDIAHRAPREKYLELFNHIDVHLDTFPYNGCTTTCDALWMGVPTVTLAGRAYASRMGLSLLTHAGLADLVATSPAEYVNIAAGLATNQPRRTELRESMRHRLLKSPLMDYHGLAREMESAFRFAWRQWCAALK